MNPEPAPRERQPLLARLLAPRTWVALALGLLGALAVFHLLGWRDDTRFISGSAPVNFTVVRGLLYALAYFGAVVASPILLLAASLLTFYRRLRPS
jgi:hypothetical protein